MDDETLNDEIPDILIQKAAEINQALHDFEQLCYEQFAYKKKSDEEKGLSFNWATNVKDSELLDSFILQTKQLLANQSSIIKGHIYCYRCDSANCQHSLPDDFGKVFKGYSNTGEPQWEEFFNYLNALNDNRVEKIFSQRPQLLSRLVGRKQLIENQLNGSGRNSMTYRIIGQIVAGYFLVNQKRCALTVQIVENPVRDLFVQIIAKPILIEALTDATKKGNPVFYRIFDSLKMAQKEIVKINRDWKLAKGKNERQKIVDKIFSQLRHIGNSIERKGRQSNRRTAHAEMRSNEKRPVDKAIDDLAVARHEDFYLDRRRNSIVLVGKRGRAHVFNKEGKHITSLVLNATKLDARVQRNRYRPLDKEDYDSFINIIKSDSDD